MKNNVFIALLSILTLSCIQEPVQNNLGGYIDDEEYFNEFLSDNNDTKDLNLLIDSIARDTNFIDFTNDLLNLLDNNKLTTFSDHFHPIKGCKFVPYTFISDEHLNFSSQSFQNELSQNKKLHWGMYNGSGEAIDLTIQDYFKQFVYDENFKNNSTEIHINSDLEFSNSLNNILDFFPESDYIELYYEGTKEHEGMDWSSLLFYIEQFKDTYYLVAVVHNQWTT
jgi:hypothetical protein